MKRQRVDWDVIEPHYRAGVRSLKDIGAEFGVSDAGIIKHAREAGWTRNLKAKIQARTDAKVSAAMVSAEVSAQTKITEAVRIEVESEVAARIKLSHRTDITRMRALVLRLLEECEAEAADPGMFAEIGELMRCPDDTGTDRLNDAYRKAISLPQRIKGVKELAETMKTLIGLEREAYGLDEDKPDPAKDAAIASMTPNEIARRIAFALAQGLQQKGQTT